MVILQLLRQGFTSATNVVRGNLAANAAHKRLFKKLSQSGLVSTNRLYGAYEGDGRTVGFVINKKDAEVLLLSGTTTQGFVLSNGVELMGSIILFPHSIMNWNVHSASEVNEDSLSLFRILDPKIDILVFGYGSKNAYTREIKENFHRICKNLGLRFEALPTEDAAGLYNFLADDRRLVAAALIPPDRLNPLRFEEEAGPDLLEDLEEEKEGTLLNDGKSSKKLIK